MPGRWLFAIAIHQHGYVPAAPSGMAPNVAFGAANADKLFQGSIPEEPKGTPRSGDTPVAKTSRPSTPRGSDMDGYGPVKGSPFPSQHQRLPVSVEKRRVERYVQHFNIAGRDSPRERIPERRSLSTPRNRSTQRQSNSPRRNSRSPPGELSVEKSIASLGGPRTEGTTPGSCGIW